MEKKNTVTAAVIAALLAIGVGAYLLFRKKEVVTNGSDKKIEITQTNVVESQNNPGQYYINVTFKNNSHNVFEDPQNIHPINGWYQVVDENGNLGGLNMVASLMTPVGGISSFTTDNFDLGARLRVTVSHESFEGQEVEDDFREVVIQL